MTKKTKILYVEDDPGSQMLVSRVLEIDDYNVVIAKSGLEGIQKATSENPNLILMDINIGDMDGYEVTTRLRSISTLKNVPIIALTANTLQGDRERALVAGCDGYISKPIDIDELPQQINSFLKGHRETVPVEQKINYLTEYNQQIVEHLESKVRELKEANQALQNLEKMKSDFIIMSAHELRTPLTMVYGYARLLMTQKAVKEQTFPGSQEVKFLSHKIFDSMSRLNEVVNDILNIALIQANKMEIDAQTISLEEIIKSALIELDPFEKGRDLEITINSSLEKLPNIEGDSEKLRQVFWNLLSNAVKYTPDGGQIIVDAKIEPDTIHITVKDNGIGIPQEDQKNIFESFYISGDTTHHSSSKVDFMGGGMGIGLSIAKGIINAHKGNIFVESSGIKGQGSTFHVKLPFKQAEGNV